MMYLKIILLCSFVLFSINACNRGNDQKIDGPTVALVLKTLNNPYFIDMQSGAEKQAKLSGLNLIVQAAEREVDVEKQMQIIENLIQTKVDVICVTPSGSKEIVPAIVKANKEKIPVLVLDTRVDSTSLAESGGRIETFIGSDNFEGGRIAGQYIVEKLGGKGNVVLLEGIPGHETGDARLSGFHSVAKLNPGIKILTSQTANWERDQGFNVFQNIMQSYPEVQALFACSDLMALGAIEAIAAAGRTEDIVVVGFDALKDARDAILANKMDASIAQHSDIMGKVAIENAKRLLDGKSIPRYIPISIDLITRDNAGIKK